MQDYKASISEMIDEISDERFLRQVYTIVIQYIRRHRTEGAA